MSAFRALCRREVVATLRSPGTWMLLGAFQFLSALFFLLVVTQTRSSRLAPVFYDIGVLLIFLAPMMTAPAFASEWRDGTMELLLTSALAPRHVVLAKFAGVMTPIAMIALLSLQYPLWIGFAADVDLPASLCAALGTLLLGGAAAGIGLAAAAATRSFAAAALLGFAAILGFWFLHSIGLALGAAPEGWADRFSLYLRFGPFTRGLLDTADLAFFAILTAGSLAVAAAGLEAARSARS